MGPLSVERGYANSLQLVAEYIMNYCSISFSGKEMERTKDGKSNNKNKCPVYAFVHIAHDMMKSWYFPFSVVEEVWRVRRA